MHHIDYRYLRPKKAAWMKKMMQSSFPMRRNLTFWRGEGAIILPRRLLSRAVYSNGQGGVLDQNEQFVELSANPGRIGGTYPVDKLFYREERVVFCGYLYQHWGHFLVESVSRLWYFMQNDPTVDKYVFFLDNDQDRKIGRNHQAFLELLGIWDKTIFLTCPTRFREVIVPEPSYVCMQYWSEQYLTVFDAVARNVQPDPSWETPKKIFFTRSLFAKGSEYEFGLDALDDFFHTNGYTILSPETFSLAQMIHYIRNASVVASISGTLPHNMLFGKNGQKIEILERLVINVDHQVCINQMRQLEAVHIDANYPIYPVDTHGPIWSAAIIF